MSTTRRILATAAAPLALVGCQQPAAQLSANLPTESTSTTEAPASDANPSTTDVESSPGTSNETTSTLVVIPQTSTTIAVQLPTTLPLPQESVARSTLPVDLSLTPYNGWAIPEYIVMCESGGDWEAWNPSGAAGAYQLMPFHLGGDARLFTRSVQHAKAAELWAGGAGWRHWAACV